MVEIVILAMVAVFLGLHLYAVLGKRTGHEQTMTKPAEEPVAPLAAPRTLPERAIEAPPVEGEPISAAAMRAVRAIVAADRQFDVDRFLDGARNAYRMILEAYWSHDRETLATLVDGDVNSAFVEAIDAREAAGERLDNRLVAIERATIVNATVDGRTARITVAFEADVSAVTRDKDGKVIAGSLSDAVPTHDVWTFARSLDARDPNWILVDTDEAR